MEDLRQTTIDTYNTSAAELANFFAGIGPRKIDIDRAFELAGNPHAPKVLEIGCGDGRDASDIAARTPNYLGIDISESMIAIASQKVPQASFEVSDVVGYSFPKELDIVFAFASLLHLNRSEMRTTLNGIANALKPGGILYTSLKYRPEYTEEIKEDQFGRRLFYFYNAETITEMTATRYAMVGSWQEQRGDTKWFELALKRK